MTQLSSFESGIDPNRLQQLVAIGQSRDVAALVDSLQIIYRDSCQALQLVWIRGDTPTVLGGFGAVLPYSPTPAELELLGRGTLVSTLRSPETARLLVPLQAHGTLCGWLLLEGSLPSTESHPMQQLVAAQVALTLSSLRQYAAPSGAYRHLRTLIDVSRNLGSTLDVDALLQIIERGARQIVDDQPAVICVVLSDRGGQQIETALVALDPLTQLTLHNRPLAATLSAVVLQQGSPLLVDDYQEDCRRRGFEPLTWPDIPLCYSWIGVPMRANDQAIGVLTMGSLRRDYRFGHEQVELLTTMANQAATAIENARLYQCSQRQAQQLAALNRISRIITSSLDVEQMPQLIMEQACQLLEVEEGSLLLADANNDLIFTYTSGPAGERLLGQRIPRGTGIAGYVVSTGRSEIVNNVQEDRRFYNGTDVQTGFVTRSILAVPLVGRTRIEGVIEVINKRAGQPFTDDDRALIEALADQAVVALENAQRFTLVDQALARRAQRLAVSNAQLREILRIGNMLRVERRLDELLSQIAQGVSECTSFRTAVISLVRRYGVGYPELEHISVAGLPAVRAKDLPRLPLEVVERMLRPQARLSDNTYLLPLEEVRPLLRENAFPSLEGCNGAGLILCPLCNTSGDMLGLLAVTVAPATEEPTIEQVQSLEIFANQAAAVIENAHLYNRLQHNLQSLTALNALSMALYSTLRSVEQIVSMTAGGAVASTGALGAAVLLCTAGDELPQLVWASATLDSPELARLAARVAASQRLEQLSADSQTLPGQISAAGGRSIVAVPLRATQNVLGAMIVYYAETAPADSARETLVLFASQAAVAIESLRLLNALHEGRDRLMSIMASTREGMLMIAPDGRVLVANAALHRLCDLQHPIESWPIAAFFDAWCGTTPCPSEECQALRQAVAQVSAGEADFVDGELNMHGARPQSIEWSVLPVLGEGRSGGGVLLVLRDITAAKATEQLRQDLTSMIIHDLRSPISSVIAALDLLFRGIPGPLTPSQRSVLSIAHTSSQNMLNMVSMLLDISRLEGGSLPLDCVPLQLGPLVTQACQHLEQLAASRHIQLEFVIGAELPAVLADDELILRVCQNLLDNAVKFSSTGGVVRVAVGVAQDEGRPVVVVTVNDHGLGIAPEHQAKIFQKFEQVGERRGGSGLGLTFCQLVVEAHGGRIWVESCPGQGSTFRFSLPVATAESPVPHMLQ